MLKMIKLIKAVKSLYKLDNNYQAFFVIICLKIEKLFHAQ